MFVSPKGTVDSYISIDRNCHFWRQKKNGGMHFLNAVGKPVKFNFEKPIEIQTDCGRLNLHMQPNLN